MKEPKSEAANQDTALASAHGSAWGLWDRGKKGWRTAGGVRQEFESRHAAERYKVNLTRGIRKDPLIAYYRAFVSPRRLPPND